VSVGAWKAVEPGVCPAGDVGGDMQAGEAWDIRFWHVDRPGAVVTVWVYPVKHESRPGYQVQALTQLTICTDRAEPGATEEWADTFSRDDPAVHSSPALAGTAARELARRYAAGQVHVTSWDGETWSVPAADRQR
jgi:hypothetical protein